MWIGLLLLRRSSDDDVDGVVADIVVGVADGYAGLQAEFAFDAGFLGDQEDMDIGILTGNGFRNGDLVVGEHSDDAGEKFTVRLVDGGSGLRPYGYWQRGAQEEEGDGEQTNHIYSLCHAGKAGMRTRIKVHSSLRLRPHRRVPGRTGRPTIPVKLR